MKTLSGSGLCATMEGCVIGRTETPGSTTVQTVVYVHNGGKMEEVSLELRNRISPVLWQTASSRYTNYIFCEENCRIHI